MKNIIDFHKNNGYYVNISPIPKTTGCIVNFPANLIHNFPPITKTYIITNSGEIELYNKVDKDTKLVNINTNKLNARLLVFQDIFLKATKRGFSRHLIIVENHNDLFSLLNIPMTDEELALEKELFLLFRKILEGKVMTDVKKELEKSYLQIVYYFENGGF